ncbi:MAG: chemotaxis protein CheB [Nodosilinea sp.]
MGDNVEREYAADGFFIVGIGASAGGVKALESFFASVPDDPNAAFVVVQHLSPNHKSMMTEILQRQTVMTVSEAEDHVLLKPGHVYVLPPRKNMVIEKRRLHLTERSEAFDYPINRFFKSLIEGWGDRIIAILLSGTGEDGTEGLQTVSQAGAIALVQSPETAQFTSMPTSAIPSGLVDEVLSPQDLAKTVFELIRFSDNFPESTAEDANLIDPDQLQRILDILAERENTDFSHYKVSTLSRRIHHRCAITRQANIEAYLRLLSRSTEEQKLLRQDMLIGATNFFRDPAAWRLLEQEVLPALIENLKDGQQFRVWVSACATGEEAYSMAILVDEALRRSNRAVQVKIFATDLDTNALEVAAQGVYPETIADHISPERLNYYFNFENGYYHVSRSLRAMLTVASHDLTKNAGFSKMNLVSCRNVLIYMQPQLQQQVLRLLHFALATEGVLFLGSSETLGDMEPEFKTINRPCKLFSKQRDSQLSDIPISRQSFFEPVAFSGRSKARDSQTNRLMGEVFRYALPERQITCLLINPDNRLLRVFYNSANLLEFPVGETVYDATEIVHPALRLPLSTALHRSNRDQQTVLYSGIRLDQNGEDRLVNLRVGLDQSNPAASETLLIAVLEICQRQTTTEDEPATDRRYDPGDEAAEQINELEYELQQTRENLQVTIEELETTNEEQQATNEEMLASNEELQSTNEELQSVNEELYTVNAEYESKIQELTQLNNDIDNLLRSTDIGVVFLDSALNIRKFTPAATTSINIRPTDLNRPLADLTNNLDCPRLFEMIQSVLDSGQSIEREVTQVQSGQHLLMRINPYLQDGNRQEGVVLTFININELKHVQSRLEQANAMLENLYAFSPAGLGLLDDQLRFVRINQTLANINGAAVEDHQGRSVDEMLPTFADTLFPRLNRVLETGRAVEELEIRGTSSQSPNREQTWLASCYPVDFDTGRRGIGMVMVEVTQMVETEAELRHSEARLIEQNQALEDAIAVAQTADAANQAKSEFLSNISHELRTPLNSILGVQQLLMRSEVVNSHGRLLQMLKGNSEQLLSLVNDILDLAKIESRRLELEQRSFSLTHLIGLVRDMFELQIQQKQLLLRTEVDEAIPDPLIGDDFRLQQVLSNLLSNALKFTSDGSIAVSVGFAESGSSHDGQAPDRAANPAIVWLRFAVADTGVGIAADQQSDLFQPFTQADGSTTRQYGGTGLGLAICRRIVELMGGQIGLESTLGQGSVFWFTVPLQTAAEEDSPAASEGSVVGSLEAAAASPLANLNILVVEDNPDNRELIATILKDTSCKMAFAVNGQQVLDKLAAESFDLVLMDCQMPVMDGYEATRQLRQREGGQRHIPVIGLTAHAGAENRQRCLQAGMDDYISKPLNIQHLKELIMRWTLYQGRLTR